jgi:hypothetical protein
MWRIIPLLGATSLLVTSASRAQSLDTKTISEVAATTRSVCLSGSQYDLQVNADGSLSLLKLEPGGQGKIRITQSTGTGGALNYQDEGKRVEADKNIIGCINRNLPVLLTAAGAQLAAPAKKGIKPGTMLHILNEGLPPTRRPETLIHPGLHASARMHSGDSE